MKIINLIENTEGAAGCAHNGIISITDAYMENTALHRIWR
jgi:metal-dependent hydrolase (beta-lactamase superfamily II)